MSEVIAEPVAAGDLATVAALIERGFTRFVAPDLRPEGKVAFRMFAAAAALRQRLDAGGIGMIAREGEAIRGYIELTARAQWRDGVAHLNLLFVEPDAHRRGIARALFEACRVNSWPRSITVNASAYAEPAYRRLGFVPTGDLDWRQGMLCVPMRWGEPD